MSEVKPQADHFKKILTKELMVYSEFTNELMLQPRRVSAAIAARAALRAFCSFGTLDMFDRLLGGERCWILLSALRSISLSTAAVFYPTFRKESQFRTAARTAERKFFSDLPAAAADAAATSAAKAAASISSHKAALHASDAVFMSAGKSRPDGISNAAPTVTDTIDAETELAFLLNYNTPITLMRAPLWFGVRPLDTENLYSRLKAMLPPDEDWDVWTRWFERLRDGHGLVSEELERFRVLQPEEFWKKEPAQINKAIKDKERELGLLDLPDFQTLPGIPDTDFADFVQPRTTSSPSSPDAQPILPEIPPLARAAIEPVIENGKVRLPKDIVKADLTPEKAAAALRALRKLARELIDETAAEDNIDKRAKAFLEKLARAIPSKPPKPEKLYGVAHEYERLQAYAQIVTVEWPAPQAAAYHSFVLAFEKTFRQFPDWREIIDNAANRILTTEELRQAQSFADAMISAMQSLAAAETIAPEVPSALKELNTPLATEPAAPGRSRILDTLESINNTLKRQSEVALGSLEHSRGTKKNKHLPVARRGLKKLRSGALGEFDKQMEGAGRWSVRAAFMLVKFGSVAGLTYVVSTFTGWAWVIPVLAYAKATLRRLGVTSAFDPD